MNAKQPEALRLADALMEDNKTSDCVKAAAELRRLHEVEQNRNELLAALEEVVKAERSNGRGGWGYPATDKHRVTVRSAWERVHAAIAKAEGRT